MSMYLTFDEYIEMGGTITDISTFTQYEFKVSKVVDDMTANRLKSMEEIPMAVKLCEFDMISQEQLYADTVKNITANVTANGGTGLVTSFSTDGYQESYGGGSKTSGEYIQSLFSALKVNEKNTIQNYLAYEYDDNNVKLLYRGVG